MGGRGGFARMCAIRDFGADAGTIAGRTDLAQILTMVIWTAGPQHAAVNQLASCFLGVIHETKLGDYDDDFKHTPVADGLHGLQQNLSAAKDEIIGRHRRRPHTYDYLRPSLIPNSTNI